jgi:hypothetical protein
MSEIDLQRQIDQLSRIVKDLQAQQTLTGVAPLNPGNTDVGINIVSPECALHVVTAVNTQPRGIAIDNYHASSSAGSIITRKARGTFASPSALLSGDGLGAYCFQGWSGSGFGSATKHAAIIQALATENWSAGNNGCQMIFTVTPNASETIFTALTIDQDGDIYTEDKTDYSSVSTIVGFSAYTTKLIHYRRIGKMVLVRFTLAGTSNSTALSFTVPYTSDGDGMNTDTITRGADNSGAAGITLTRLPAGSNIVTCYKDVTGATWTASNNKSCNGWFIYYAA